MSQGYITGYSTLAKHGNANELRSFLFSVGGSAIRLGGVYFCSIATPPGSLVLKFVHNLSSCQSQSSTVDHGFLPTNHTSTQRSQLLARQALWHLKSTR